MDLGGRRLLALVAEEEHALGVEEAGEWSVLQLTGADGQAALDQGHREAVELRHVWIAGRGLFTLEHEGIADEHAEALRAAIPAEVGLLHVRQRAPDNLEFAGVAGRDRLAVRRRDVAGVLAAEDALRPGGDFVF